MTKRPRLKITSDTSGSKLRSGSFMLLGLIGLQIGLILAALIFLPAEQRSNDLDAVAALDAPPAAVIESAPVLPVQPVLPTAELIARPVVDPPQPVAPTPEQIAHVMPAAPSALRVRGMEVTQGIQVFNEPERDRVLQDVEDWLESQLTG